jgi:hypothetical protein
MRFNRRKMQTAVSAGLALHLTAVPSGAQESSSRLDALHQLNDSVATLVRDVSQSVVQVLVTSYGPVEPANRTDTDMVIGRQRSIGSGVVVAAGGYIMTILRARS